MRRTLRSDLNRLVGELMAQRDAARKDGDRGGVEAYTFAIDQLNAALARWQFEVVKDGDACR